MPYGHSRVRNVPSARPKRLLAPSATTMYSARTSIGAAVGALHRGAAHEAALDERVHAPRGPASTVAPALLGVGGDELVELAPAHDVAVLGVDRVRRPLQLELAAHAGGPQAWKRWKRSSSPPRPMSSSCLTARGVRPSPQVFSRGNVFFSRP